VRHVQSNQLEVDNVVLEGGLLQLEKPVMDEAFEDMQTMILAKLDVLKKT
jgi:hypothetical protein